MERLPYIDEHRTAIAAHRAAVWAGLLRVVCRNPADPTTVPAGFRLELARPPDRLALHGRHPFAVYRLVFDLTDDGAGRTVVAARSWARFPGLRGRLYRALVIGSGGHRVVVRAMLGRIAAESGRAVPSP